jgi:hypothetical protein
MNDETQNLRAARLGPNQWRIRATKVGATAEDASGKVYKWTEQGIQAAVPGWNSDGIVTINHGPQKWGKITVAEYVAPAAYMNVEVDAMLDGWIERNKDHIGVSIEAADAQTQEDNILASRGTGITFVFPPYRPHCSVDQGCGIVSAFISLVEATEKESVMEDHSIDGEEMTDQNDAAKTEMDALKATISVKDKDIEALKAEKVALEASVKDLSAFKEQRLEEDRKAVLATLASKMDVKGFENEPICVLKKMLAAAESAAKNVEATKVENSGADVVGTKTEDPDAGLSSEDKKALEAARKAAAPYGIKI